MRATRAALLIAVAAAPGCLHPRPATGDYAITAVPPAAPDVGSSAALAAEAPEEPIPPPRVTGAAGLEIPPTLPSAGVPPFRMPDLKGLKGAERDAAIKAAFPVLPPLDPEAEPPGPPLALADLEQIGLANHPAIKQAAADVQAARGRMIQAGLLPNPEIGYQSDQMNSGMGVQTRGQQGGYVAWEWITAGKLSLARLAEAMAYANAQVALRKAQIDVTVEVRRQYFAALVARQTVRVNRALAEFSGEIYAAQLQLLSAGELAGYEPLSSYVLAVQARGTLAQSRNRQVSAWRQLAAAMGTPEMPPAALAGRADVPAPEYDFDALREIMLAGHTDVQTAQNAVQEARYRLRLAEVTPIPDIKAQMYVQRDWSTPPYNTQVGVQAGGPIPVFNRNQGGRLTAQADLARAIQGITRAQTDLSARIAPAWETYATNRVLVRFYRDHAIPNQVRVYRGTFERFRKDPEAINYSDVVNTQQTLTQVLTAYLTALGSQWNAVADLSALSQQPELYPTGGLPTDGGASLDGMLAPPRPVEPAPAPPGPR